MTRDLEINYAKTNINSLNGHRDRINKPPKCHQDNSVYICVFAYILGLAHSYSVATFAIKNHFKLWEAFKWELTARPIFSDWLWKTGTVTYYKRLLTDVNKYRFLTNNFSKMKQTSNRPIWLTKDGSKPTNDQWQALHESCSQYH